MTTLDIILSKAAARADAIRDRVTGRAEQVLGSKKRVRPRVIWSVGDFPYPWPSEQAEIDALTDGSWFPSKKDFAAALNNSGKKSKDYQFIDHTDSFINFIYQQPKGSISRFNFVTHGASDSIGLKGRIEDDGVYFDEELEAGRLEGFRDNGLQIDEKTVVPWSEVKARFSKDAVIAIYACRAALSEDFLQFLADTFGVAVHGFSKELHYTYSAEALQGGKINRKLLKVDGESNITALTPDVIKTPSAQAQQPSP